MAEAPADSSEMLVRFLARRDVECPSCRYNLRDQEKNICPECGESVTLGLHMVEPRQAAPLAGLIGLSAGAGLNALLFIYLLISMVRFAFMRSLWREFVLANLPQLIVLGVLITFWLRGWRWIRRRSARVRWSLAILCWVASLADIVIFTFIIKH